MLPLMAQQLFLHNFDRSMYVETYQAREIILHNDSTIGVNIDGEYKEYTSDLHFDIIPKSLNIIIP